MIKKVSFMFLFVCSFFIQSTAQQANRSDTIEIVKDFFAGLKFYRNDKRLTMGEMSNLMRPNEEAFKYLNKARTNNTVAFITGFIGGALIGYELGGLLGGDEINWGVMGAGTGFIVIAIPFDGGARRNARKAVALYNAAYR